MIDKLKKVVQFILNPRLLFCVFIAWLITNGFYDKAKNAVHNRRAKNADKKRDGNYGNTITRDAP